jgi:hypothetical protein
MEFVILFGFLVSLFAFVMTIARSELLGAEKDANDFAARTSAAEGKLARIGVILQNEECLRRQIEEIAAVVNS